ncbi:MAG: ribonucleoside-diphosphate reductase alpha chain [Woeseiaceae bacterium]|jgi:ribonucleoside-diphosphate reductase alpha chain
MEMMQFSESIWKSKYRYTQGRNACEEDIGDTWRRVAGAIATIESDSDAWQQAFYEILSDYRFLPGGRILAGAGTTKQVTLFNCFVMGPILDSIENIFDALKEAAVTLQQGGGIGCDFSALRPAGSPATNSGTIASGPVPFMRIWNTLCETMLATGTRRGAMMATLRCDHPDIEAFIDAKRQGHALNNFNLSVLVTDDFMKAVADNADWELRYPSTDSEASLSYRRLPARRLWHQIITAAHETAEPGVLFIDSINRENNLYYCETISATNPCGEVPLPPYGACNLGSINLTAFIRQPFTKDANLDEHALGETVEVAVRFLDNVIDVSRFPLDSQAEQARGTRRIGLGITGLADMLVMSGLHYGSDAGRSAAARAMQVIRDSAYGSSIRLAEEKGAFPLLDRRKYLQAPFIHRLPGALKSKIGDIGIRNSHLLAIAPTGTISLLAGNISSGIEPIYAFEADRSVRDSDLQMHRFAVRDPAYDLWLAGDHEREKLPEYFVTADALPPLAHLKMQSCLQGYVDNAISKTVNLPESATVDDVAEIYSSAHALGIKGCTVFRPGALRGQVLHSRDDSHCCDIDREAD